jgi:serine/threonine protein phosphatase PrpC
MWHVSEGIGMRPYMEDRHLVIPEFYMGYTLLAVFDGHGGAEVAAHCKRVFPKILKDHMDTFGVFDMRMILMKSFSAVHIALPANTSEFCGTTALVILKHKNHLWVANCGDSRAIMNVQERVRSLTQDHKPSDLSEKRRIEALGGTVIPVQGVARVSGELAVSRSIGDRRYNPFVTSEPEVFYYPIAPMNKFVVLATDGLWDVMSNNDVNRWVWNVLVEQQSCARAADSILKFAFNSRNAEDNITVVVYLL